MSDPLLIWICIVALAVACVAAIAVHSLRDFSRGQLRELLRDRDQLSRFDEIIIHHRQAALGAECLRMLATSIAVLSAAHFGWNHRPEQDSWPTAVALDTAELVGGAVVLGLLVIWWPSAAARIWAEPFVARTWSVWRLCGRLLAPSVAATEMAEQALQKISGKSQHLTEEELEEEIREVVTEGQREGLIEEEAREMIESVISLGEVKVSEIMTPRTDMVSMPVDISWDDALQSVIASGHTRIPVYGESRDEVVGILHIKDMLQELVHGSQHSHRPIADLLRPPFFVPETKAVNDLLQEFQRSRNHIAVVLDEYGGVSGLVTIEDALEEIVGEIADEHDEERGEGVKIFDERNCEALARVHISEINERLGVHLPDVEHFDTIGGLVFHRLGRIPHPGEELTLDGVKIRVLEATRRRINRVAIEVLPPAGATTSDEVAAEREAQKR